MQRWAIWCLGLITLCCVGAFTATTREYQCLAPWQQRLTDDAALDAIDQGLPPGWTAGAPGVRVGTFSVAGGHSVHLLGIGTWFGLPPQPVNGGAHLCVRAAALADSTSATKIRTRWVWTLADGSTRSQVGPWHAVRAWGGSADTKPWSTVVDTTVAPAHASQVEVRFEPASDDRLYVDQISVRTSHVGSALPIVDTPDTHVRIRPWPAGTNAAVSFSYDFESAMGGLVHSRSVDDPNAATDPVVRAQRMRAGLWHSLDLYAPHGYAATYYVNGYNFLDSNESRRMFMGNPTFAWATKANGWQTDMWAQRPWFSVDPYLDARAGADWYFGDLIAPLVAAGHDIQSHTFAHFYGGYASPTEWQADLAQWNRLAAEKGLAPARSLAFPWSSSAGMQHASWDVLTNAGITSLTRTAWNPKLPQYHIVEAAEARCAPLPAHATVVVCPDFYLTVARAAAARQVVDDIRTKDGVIDFWAHTEEVTTPEQIAAWRSVVDTVAQAGDIWVAPMAEIAARQQAIWALEQTVTVRAGMTYLVLHNPTDAAIQHVALAPLAGWRIADSPTTGYDIPAHGEVVIRLDPE
ncbi:MAG: hypothetical protein RLZZ297_908 [Chloroflexota bacterium]